MLWLMPCVLFCLISHLAKAQADSASEPKRKSLLSVQFHIKNNQVPYIKVQTKIKSDKGLFAAENIPVSIYMDDDLSKDALVGQVKTNTAGQAALGIPASLAANWKTKSSHTFFAHTDSSSAFDAVSQEVAVVLAKIELDTVVDGANRSLVATVLKNEGESWVPMNEVELRVGVKRFGGYLTVGEEDTYTTDSTGKVEVAFVRENLPGDKLGKLEVFALVDDNEEIGSLETGIVVPWGVVHQYKNDFGERSLWAPPRKAPIWLLLMAYGCIIAVWSMIIYLFTRILQIRRLGKVRN